MVKSGHRRKKAEKAKVQLKASQKGAKKSLRLQKGHNVTKADVRTKQIVLLNQLEPRSQDGDLSLLTKKRLGIKELLAKVANQSTSTRMEGLAGLQELLLPNAKDQRGPPEGLVDNERASLLVARLAPLISERESKVRRMGSAVLKTILIQAKDRGVNLESQFPMLCAHLCCGLTSILEDVQRDSLEFLDAAVESQPDLVHSNFDALLPRCADQISKVKLAPPALSSSASAAASLDKSRVLTVSTTDKVAALQRRFEVVDRVRKMIRVVVVRSGRSADSLRRSSAVSVQKSGFPDDGRSPLYVGLYPDVEADDPLLTSDLREFAETTGRSQMAMTDQSCRRTLLTGLIPVLLQTWQETATAGGAATPSSTGSRFKPFGTFSMAGATVLSHEALQVLDAVCDVIDLITVLLESGPGGGGHQDGRDQGDRDVADLILGRFPFEMSGGGNAAGPPGGRRSGSKPSGNGAENAPPPDPNLADMVNLSVASLALKKLATLSDPSAAVRVILDHLDSYPAAAAASPARWGRSKADRMAGVLRLLAAHVQERETGRLCKILAWFSGVEAAAAARHSSFKDLMCDLATELQCPPFVREGLRRQLDAFVRSLPSMALKGDVNLKGLRTLEELLRMRDPALMEALARMDRPEFEKGLRGRLEEALEENKPRQELALETCKTLAFMSAHIPVGSADGALQKMIGVRCDFAAGDERAYICSVVRNLCSVGTSS